MAGFRLLLPALLFFAILSQFNLYKAQTLVHQFCYDDYLQNSTYSTNLDLLLSSISNYSNGNNTDIYFYNVTVGTSPNRVYGIFQCRGDLTSEDCKKCAKVSTETIKIKCPNKQDITMWYDECMLRYSYNPIVSAMTLTPEKCFSYADNATDPVRFTVSLNNLMNGLVSRAVNSTNMFATGEEEVPNSGKVYGLVQCTQDIDKRDCQRCLSTSVNGIPTCVSGKNGGRILKPSCVVWFQSYEFFESNGTDFLPAPYVNIHPGKDRTYKIIIIILIPTLALLIIILFFSARKIKRLEIAIGTYETPSVESLQFNIGTILSATNNFSDDNKLGEGGFGSVYKGTLKDGQEIAVKRLAKHSSQGVQEFKNEVLLLAKLQHKFLVRLLGFCLGRDEKLLIYEYVPNRSLDLFIFDSSKDTCLNWEQRYKIIGGVARGLLYLHEDSQHRIIHRDLKASNILLDAEMNPKIADFGLARLFVSDQTHGSTNKVVGTYGYMSPEYLIRGQFSAKSDVFSFGVLVLEIITGQKNSNFEGNESSQDLLSYAYRQWEQGTFLEMIDPMLKECYSRNEVMNCIHMGLLCVQDDFMKRPTMETVVLMLNSYSITLPVPSTPAFFPNGRTDFKGIMDKESKSRTEENKHLAPDRSMSGSIDDNSITDMYPR